LLWRNPSAGNLLLRLPELIAFIMAAIEYQPADEHNSLRFDLRFDLLDADAKPPLQVCGGDL